MNIHPLIRTNIYNLGKIFYFIFPLWRREEINTIVTHLEFDHDHGIITRKLCIMLFYYLRITYWREWYIFKHTESGYILGEKISKKKGNPTNRL